MDTLEAGEETEEEEEEPIAIDVEDATRTHSTHLTITRSSSRITQTTHPIIDVE